ncbi:RlpA-like double-psi beta-barrel-protein domain-containing protein-containing protein [Syncephalastrum racemosum]|uniref:RlpA-like double-psi beta-barrel-protein domain-containing protein-containing protein n=1 Tax=Syncephalastrum racemosum TaxID=13706 RepID=A0A1X2HIE5_SYNRA|nr:RlpA-like double-psi beta-barrel-protein domain-containing protein-containing protein [Syncephalastrum racemosum]
MALLILTDSQPVKRAKCSKPAGALAHIAHDVLKKLSGTFSGSGTFFNPVKEGGPIGSCGPRESEKSHIVALNRIQYGDTSKKSHFCGKKVRINYKGKIVFAIINDACPGCAEGSLDMTPVIFNKLEAPKVGVIPITWCVVGTDGCEDEDADDECT